VSDPTETDYRTRAPAELNDLRETVETWLKRAVRSLETFYRKGDDGTFLLDSDPKSSNPGEPFNTTTTARAYKAMVSATWRMSGEKGFYLSESAIANRFKVLAKSRPYSAWKDGTSGNWRYLVWPNTSLSPDRIPSDVRSKCDLNSFDIIHLADYAYAQHRLEIFGHSAGLYSNLFREVSEPALAGNEYRLQDVGSPSVSNHLLESILQMLRKAAEEPESLNVGKIPLVPERATHHFLLRCMPSGHFHFFAPAWASRRRILSIQSRRSWKHADGFAWSSASTHLVTDVTNSTAPVSFFR